MTNKKTFLIALSFLFLGSLMRTNVYAAQCTAGECNRPGEYICDGGTKCCTCRGDECGCPSYVCSQNYIYQGLSTAGEVVCAQDVTENNCVTCKGPLSEFDGDYCNVIPSVNNGIYCDGTCNSNQVCTSYIVREGVDVGGTCRSCGGSGGNACGCKKVCSSSGGICGYGSDSSPVDGQPDPKYNCYGNQCDDDDGACTVDAIGTYGPPISTDKSTYAYANNVKFAWNEPYSPKMVDGEWEYYIDWGVCCGSCGAGVKLYVNGKHLYTHTASAYIKSLSASLFKIGSNTWYVLAYNGNAGQIKSGTGTFTVEAPPPVTVRGKIWNATGQACNVSSNKKDTLEIVRGSAQGNVATAIKLRMDGTTAGSWNTNYDGYSYRFTNVEQGIHSISANVPDPVGYPNSSYELACVNNAAGSVIPSVNASADPTILNLGYEITTSASSWFQSIGGDIFGGCDVASCANSVSVDVPGNGETLGGFNNNLIATPGTLFGDSGLSVTDDSYSQDSNRHLEYMNSVDLWPSSLTFTPPSSATQINSNCSSMFQGNNLDAGIVYKASVGCVQSGLDGLTGNYNFTHDGVAVIYVQGTGTLTFKKTFTGSSNGRRRVLFVTQGPVKFNADIGDAAPTTSTAAHIQAGIISESSITFLSTGLEDDTTIIVEGPLVTKTGTINNSRNRGINNGYPAVVVKYNTLYLTSLTASQPAGLSAVDISWVLN